MERTPCGFRRIGRLMEQSLSWRVVIDLPASAWKRPALLHGSCRNRSLAGASSTVTAAAQHVSNGVTLQSLRSSTVDRMIFCALSMCLTFA